MEKTLKVINSLVEKGIIRAYAIGGGMAATFYSEPTLTYDLDLFVILPADSEDIRPLKHTYEYLKGQGYKESHEGINIEGILTQFLLPYNSLIEEAINEAVTACYNEIEAKIVTLEHLIAIMLQTFRPKDKLRLANFVELSSCRKAEVKLDNRKLLDILERHNLTRQWNDFIKKNRE